MGEVGGNDEILDDEAAPRALVVPRKSVVDVEGCEAVAGGGPDTMAEVEDT